MPAGRGTNPGEAQTEALLAHGKTRPEIERAARLAVAWKLRDRPRAEAREVLAMLGLDQPAKAGAA